MKQSIRDMVTGELTLDYFVRRSAEGWKLASIEWVRESDAVKGSAGVSDLLSSPTPVPYGLQVAEDSRRLEENPLEATVLLLVLEQIIQEKRIQEIANQLNLQGYSTREGTPWSATHVFNLMPRLIEAGPSLLKSAAWQQRRPSAQTRH
ncbi:MAG: recombinase family protein [Acidobacteriaceae bacterium]|nr:recombinase family protein [Acidobacteriaceae bacterium]